MFILLYYNGLMMGQAWGETIRFLINIFIQVNWLWSKNFVSLEFVVTACLMLRFRQDGFI